MTMGGISEDALLAQRRVSRGPSSPAIRRWHGTCISQTSCM